MMVAYPEFRKAKPAAMQGRKATGLTETAGLPSGMYIICITGPAQRQPGFLLTNS